MLERSVFCMSNYRSLAWSFIVLNIKLQIFTEVISARITITVHICQSWLHSTRLPGGQTSWVGCVITDQSWSQCCDNQVKLRGATSLILSQDTFPPLPLPLSVPLSEPPLLLQDCKWDLLFEDDWFPSICYPLLSLHRISEKENKWRSLEEMTSVTDLTATAWGNIFRNQKILSYLLLKGKRETICQGLTKVKSISQFFFIWVAKRLSQVNVSVQYTIIL